MNDYLCTGGGRPRPEQECCPRPEPPCPPPPPAPQPEDDGCCSCRRGFVQTLQMLLRTNLSSLIDFQSFAFVTTDFLVGSTLTAPTTTDASYDNLAADLTGTFSRFSPGACDYIDVAGTVEFPVVGGAPTGLTATRLNLCDLLAVAFDPEGETAADVTTNYQAARALFQQLLTQPRGPRPPYPPYPPFPPAPNYPPYPDPCDECCCYGQDNTMGGSVSLFAGPLLVANATVLGSIEGVMILANDTAERFYFVCSDDAELVR